MRLISVQIVREFPLVTPEKEGVCEEKGKTQWENDFDPTVTTVFCCFFSLPQPSGKWMDMVLKFFEAGGEWKVVEGIESKRILFWDDSSIVLPNKNNKRISTIMINIAPFLSL